MPSTSFIVSSSSPFVIAEISGNHGGDLEKALALIDAAHEAGADAVKFQTYTPDTITIDCDLPAFKITNGLWAGRGYYDLYQEAHTPYAWHKALFERARQVGIMAFSSAFDQTALDLLNGLGAPMIKIASCELVDIPLIKAAAKMGRPLILSTGMATMAEIEEAVLAAEEAGACEITILHCISGYPTPIQEANLGNIKALKGRFNHRIGLSDHSLGHGLAAAAAAMGAQVFEKHLCLERGSGVDGAFSLTPKEMGEYVRVVKEIALAVGDVYFGPRPSEADTLKARRSLYIIKDVAKGERVSKENIASIRPAGGLHTRFFEQAMEGFFSCALKKGTPLSVEHLAGLSVETMEYLKNASDHGAAKSAE